MGQSVFAKIKEFLEPIAKFMSNVVNFLLLTIVYIFGIGLVSIVMKLFGKRFLSLKKQNKKTNWEEHKVGKQSLETYHRTF
jgi:hypothetical protein